MERPESEYFRCILVPTIFLTIANFKTRAVSSWAALILQIYVFIRNGNRSSWLALAIILLIFCTQKKELENAGNNSFQRRNFAFFGWDRLITEVSIGTRFELYKLALKEILSHPFGVGYGAHSNSNFFANIQPRSR